MDLMVPFSRKLWVTVSADTLSLSTQIRRGYPNAGVPDTSSGRTDTEAWAVRARLDWERFAEVARVVMTAYGDLAYAQATRRAYTESGGGFPASFDSSQETAGRARIGLCATRLMFGRTTLTSMIEGVHCFQNTPADTAGELVGLLDFDIPGQKSDSDWLRAELGMEYKAIGGSVYLALNATTEGSQPAAWVSASFRRAF
jgi:hypothetical protein